VLVLDVDALPLDVEFGGVVGLGVDVDELVFEAVKIEVGADAVEVALEVDDVVFDVIAAGPDAVAPTPELVGSLPDAVELAPAADCGALLSEHPVRAATPAATAAAAAMRRNGSPVDGRADRAASPQKGQLGSDTLMCREHALHSTNRSAMANNLCSLTLMRLFGARPARPRASARASRLCLRAGFPPIVQAFASKWVPSVVR
jgi:hypothetical protein